ncbi:hypothetical protein CC1G_15596 [Coprinopsis cinerea okayama7|uniref:Ras-GEF domain-containing protein n=1 Tax=Coprinopsis cinerea (strain Okayama-7 / 130 / ATCC MYA-4618 / FGSC 9003) TaxID=240176 RepID=D6RNC6_COPC7|nr:hypothetical protein CC1G_15596 [Coprinopsis cinerea okayama7\|eukprot:XP_002911054.1 hypothetical protein CC1G_15596 [Coprinopsis cinerea okayama7\
MADYAFDHLNALVEPHCNSVFKALHADIKELALIVALLRRVYCACRKTDFGRVVGRDIQDHLSRCVLSLARVHDTVIQSPYRWVPPWKIVGSFLHIWNLQWMAVEEIRSIAWMRTAVLNWVVNLVLSKESERKRGALIKYFVTVADHCRSLNN